MIKGEAVLSRDDREERVAYLRRAIADLKARVPRHSVDGGDAC